MFLAEHLVFVAWFISIDDWSDVAHVIQSFAALVWIAMILGVAGGWIGRTRSHREAVSSRGDR